MKLFVSEVSDIKGSDNKHFKRVEKTEVSSNRHSDQSDEGEDSHADGPGSSPRREGGD